LIFKRLHESIQTFFFFYINSLEKKNKTQKTKKKKHKDEQYSESDESVGVNPISMLSNGFSNVFYSIGKFFSSFIAPDDSMRKKRQKRRRNNYSTQGRLTTEKVEPQSKRPKRENEQLPVWYYPNFLSSHNDATPSTSEHPFSSTTSLLSSWEQQSFNDDGDDVDEEIESTTTYTDVTTARATPYDFFEMFTQFFTTGRRDTSPLVAKRTRKQKYNNYQLWRLLPATDDNIAYLDEFRLASDGSKVHWLSLPSIKAINDVIVPPEYVDSFTEFLNDGDIEYDVKIRNVQHAMIFENQRLNKKELMEVTALNGHPLTWFRYHTTKDIQSYYDFLKRKYSKYIDLIQMGWSFNGKPLTIVKVSYQSHRNRYGTKRKPAIFLLSGISSHIWLPIACSNYILNALVTNIENNDAFGSLIRKFDWYVLGPLNVDGYDYAMTYDRLWSKTRSQHVTKDDGFFSNA
jgi:Zinc carboxypeptidase/Carboxypeptidase activation peptide